MSSRFLWHILRPTDAHIVSTLAPVTYMFYRSLPDKVLNAGDLSRFALNNRGGSINHFFDWHCRYPAGTAILIDNAIPDSERPPT